MVQDAGRMEDVGACHFVLSGHAAERPDVYVQSIKSKKKNRLQVCSA
jgi:hypothetical protein